MPKLVVILNGAAGGGRAEARLAPHLAALGPDVQVARTNGPGHATELARTALADGVVAAGGDGTLHEVVQGLLARDDRPALGVFPAGTGNSFVRDLGLRDLGAAAAAVAAGHTRPLDVVRVTHSAGSLFSVNLVSVGFAADAGATTNRRYKGLGVTGYVAAVLQTLVGLRPCSIPHRLDDAAFDSRPFVLLSFCNSSSTGGDMQMAPSADLSDGELDVVRIAPMNRRRFLASFPRIFRGTHGALPEVSFARASRVEFAPVGPLDVMIDGEVANLELRALEVVPRALQVFA